MSQSSGSRRAPAPARWWAPFAHVFTDWFLLGMTTAVIVASVAPGLGRSGGLLRIDRLADWGVFTIFFLHGLSLSTERLRQGLSRWRVHVVVQAFTFVVFPIVGLGLALTAGRWMPEELVFGILYLCVVPSTVSSSVAMTAIARGNVAAAIFNATLSTLLGVALTPLLVSLLIGPNRGGQSLGGMIGNVASLLLLPFLLGQLCRPFWGAWAARWKAVTSVVDRAVILMLVWSAFSDSVADGLWTRHGPGLLGTTLAVTGGMLAGVLVLSRRTSRALGFDIEDEIATVFCGSKKTLASGVPMARAIFGSHPALGVIVLPLIFYHQLQLFVCSVMAQRYAARAD